MSEIFDTEAQKYDAWYDTDFGSLVHEIEKEIVFDLLKPKAGQTVLDIGCGTGHSSIELAEKGLNVTGLDISPEMLDCAKRKSEALGAKVEWVQGDAEKLEFEDETFDRIVSVTALEFFPDPTKVLKESYRVLKPGGRMVFGVIGGSSPWSEKYEAKAREEKDSVFKHARFYTDEELLALFPGKKGRTRRGLYFSPDKDSFDREKALEEERKGREENREDAGFVAALWEK